ncbi:MAG: sulfotransferase [Nonlabens sp.]
MNIILAGPGRSGTTLFNHIFSHHEKFAWISGWVSKYPAFPQLSLFNMLYQKQLWGVNWAHVRYSPKPAEAYPFWNHFFYPFDNSNHAFDNKSITQCRETISKIKKASHKEHFVTKITGETRFEILNQVFEGDLKFLWIERDPRVVVSSYIKQKWGYKNKPKEFANLSMEDKININCSRYMSFFEDSKKIENKSLYFYEDLCEDPIAFFTNIFNKLDLNLNDELKEIIRSWEIKPVGWETKYKRQYTQEQQFMFENLLSEPLKAYNYQ